MKYLNHEEQLRIERRKYEELVAQTAKQKADLDYISMMTGIELDTETEENENDEISEG